MARWIQASRRTLLSHYFFSPKILIPQNLRSLQLEKPNFTSHFQSRNYISEMRKSTFEGHILRVLRNEIEYASESAPPKQPVNKFNSFTVDDCPGEQWIRLRSIYEGKEEIKVEVTMFDGAIPVMDSGGNEDMKFHLSLIVDVIKEGSGNVLQFICSAWPDSIEIERVFFFKRDGKPSSPYTGPEFRDLDDELQSSLLEFLEERGIDDNLAVFLHEYMLNKDKTELIRWMGNVKSFVEK